MRRWLLLLYDMRQRAIEWQCKRSRLKRVVSVFGLVLLGVMCSAVWDLVAGVETRWWVMLMIGIGAAGGLTVSLSAYTNTTLVSMYYLAQVVAPERLELVTGTIVAVNSLRMPYIGSLYQVTLKVAGEDVRVYCPGRLLQGVDRSKRVRVWSYDLFAVRVEMTGIVEMGDVSTENVS